MIRDGKFRLKTWMLLILLFPGIAEAQFDSADDGASLRGLPGIGVEILVSDEAAAAGFTEQNLRSRAEFTLLRNRIRILDYPDETLSTPGSPTLSVRVSAVELSSAPILAFHLSVRLVQTVHLTRDPSILVPRAITLDASEIGVEDRDSFSSTVLSRVTRMIDSFCAAFLAAQEQ